jgi:hypothetical protein
MKFTLYWLKDYLDTDATLDAIVARLTMIGLEVANVEDRAKVLPQLRHRPGRLSWLRVGRRCGPHRHAQIWHGVPARIFRSRCPPARHYGFARSIWPHWRAD